MENGKDDWLITLHTHFYIHYIVYGIPTGHRLRQFHSICDNCALLQCYDNDDKCLLWNCHITKAPSYLDLCAEYI